MKFQLLSDIHIDFHKDFGVSFVKSLPVLAPTIVIAGDVSEADCLENAISLFCEKWDSVLYVPGNHDRYRISREGFEDIMVSLGEKFPNFHYLNRSSIEVEGVTFHGATLWFAEDPMYRLHKSRFADFSYIPEFTPWVFDEHDRDVEFFRNSVKKGDVIITHHLPLWKCIDPEYHGSPLNRFFVGDIENIIFNNEPSLCLFGHTHKAMDFQVTEDTRVVCNPFGYPSEGNSGFNPNLVIEVSR